ncbi:MAG: beta-ketoacyl-[acyl-carrier-protein] synthase II [Gemmataceae bacterium]|nr:beta-ketoacyl-[acyl-carrier-protein] synthase II [Gemmataceae bacterium]
MRRRVVITGMGTVNPLATDVPTYWNALLEGKSGIGSIEQIDTKEFRVKFGGEVKNWKPETWFDTKACRRMDRFTQFAMVAALEAWKNAGLDTAKSDPTRMGAIVGSGIGGLSEYEEQHTKFMQGSGPRGISPFVIPKMMPNAAPGNISIHFGLAGPSRAVSTACASAADAIADAYYVMQRDEADVMVTGGSEAAITYMGLGGFIAARALSGRHDNPTAASRPFDKDRDGFVLSEGAGILVLEELEHAKKRGVPIFAELLGVASTSDAHNITAPHPEGFGAMRAMQMAVKNAGLNPTDIDYINAHGTSTDIGDAAETIAVKRAFGDHARKLAISSTKSMIGHLLGASGGAELIATVLSIQHSVVHATINLHTPDPACDLDYVPNTPRPMRVRYALSNSFGFGGHNSSVLVGAVS